MADHDEFCPTLSYNDAACVCTRLASARADEREEYGIGSIEEILHEERERIAQAIEARFYVLPLVGDREKRSYEDAARIARNGGV